MPIFFHFFVPATRRRFVVSLGERRVLDDTWCAAREFCDGQARRLFSPLGGQRLRQSPRIIPPTAPEITLTARVYGIPRKSMEKTQASPATVPQITATIATGDGKPQSQPVRFTSGFFGSSLMPSF
jgi:hypothetical protein